MDKSLKSLEQQLETLIPRAQSMESRGRCHELIDELCETSAETVKTPQNSPLGISWLGGAVAASVALALGLGGGWYLGKDQNTAPLSNLSQAQQIIAADFDQLDRETWMLGTEEPRGVYVSKEGQVRELVQETEVTKEVVQHRESGIIVTVETTDQHLIDSPKTEF